MQAYDVLMLVVLGLAVVWGAWKGLAWQVASLASLALSYFVALNFRQPLAGVINASPPWNIFLAMLLLFLGTGLVVWIGFNLIAEVIERVKLKEFDRQLGALFGAAKGVLLCVLITLFSVALLGDSHRQAICNSKSGYYIAVLLDRADAVIPTELHQVLDPYIDRLDATVAAPPQQAAGWQIPQELQNLLRAAQPSPAPGGAPAATSGSPATPASGAFPTGLPTISFGAAPAAAPPQTAGRIEAQPAAPSGASGQRRW